MHTVRRFDCNAQLAIFIVSIALIWTLYLALLGEILLGAWQLISALLNTRSMLRSPFKKRIIIYWVLVAISLLLLLFPAGVLGRSGSLETSELFFGISVLGSFAIAIYYWSTYKAFIAYLEYRKELDTLIRH